MIFDVFKKLVGSSPQVMDVNVMAKLEQVQGEWMFSVYQENPAWNVYVPLVTCDSKVADQIYNYMNQRRGSDWADCTYKSTKTPMAPLNVK